MTHASFLFNSIVIWLEVSLKICLLDERLQLGHWHSFLVAVLSLWHGLLNDSCDFLSGLREHLIHILSHRVRVAEVLERGLRRLCIAIQRCLILLEELLLDGDIVIGDAENDQAVFRLSRLLWQTSHRGLLLLSLIWLHHSAVGRYLADEFVLDQDQSFHRMLERQFVFAHLRQNGADVQVNVARIWNLKAIVHRLLAKVQVIILDLECLLQVRQRTAKLLSPSEDASEVIVGNGSITVAFLGEAHGLVQQLEADLEVLLLQEAHRQDVANYGSFACRSHQLKAMEERCYRFEFWVSQKWSEYKKRI